METNFYNYRYKYNHLSIKEKYIFKINQINQRLDRILTNKVTLTKRRIIKRLETKIEHILNKLNNVDLVLQKNWIKDEVKVLNNIKRNQSFLRSKFRLARFKKQNKSECLKCLIIFNLIDCSQSGYCKNCTNKNRMKSYKKNKKIEIERYTLRLKTDILFKLKCTLRSRLGQILRNNTKVNKPGKFIDYIGCSSLELKNHIEKQFKRGMNWGNHSSRGWHIDHIIPLCSAKTTEELYKLCNYNNLQPLWWKENISKGGKF